MRPGRRFRAAWNITLIRSLLIVLFLGVILYWLSELITNYRDTQLATGAYFFAALAGLTLLAGLGGKVSLGHGALMAVGAYTLVLLVGNEHWPLAAALAAAALVSLIIGIPIGAAASRLHGPYLAGVTLALAVGLPALADKFPATFGGENGLVINPPTAPSWLGTNVSTQLWEAWVCCAGALIVLFVLYNLVHSGIGRSLRAVRDDSIAASLCGMREGRTQTLAFAASAACAGLGGGLLAVVNQLAAPGSFQLTLSLYLLAAAVVGGLGSLTGAVWGAALLVFLPNWTNDLARSFSLSSKVSFNLPLAIYGVVLIAAMLLWPTGIQGGLWSLAGLVKRRLPAGPRARSASGADPDQR